MKLTPEKVEFWLKYRNRLHERAYIIDAMTVVANRPVQVVYDSEFPTENNRSITIDFIKLPEDAKYDAPYKNIPEHLKADPVHSWRAMTGIELVHEEPDVGELIRVYRNWFLMTQEQKEESNKKSQELFNCTNIEHFTAILEQWMQKAFHRKTYSEGDLIQIVNASGTKACVAYVTEFTQNKLSFTYLDSGEKRIFGETDTFELPGTILKCFTATEEVMTTTVGRFLLNYLLVEPFDGRIDYHNEAGMDLGKLEKEISAGLLNGEITVQQYKSYVNNLYFIGHFTELCVPAYTRAALTTDPNIKNLKAELLEKYKGRLTEPEVIAEIESKLIAADKAYLKDDESMRFFQPLGGKPFNIARKKMYLTVGGIEAFSKDSGKYTFIQNALADGWDVHAIPAIANEIRKGSYNRGHETQLGGAQTKYIVRVFQDLELVEDDCGSSKGLPIDFSIQDPSKYIGRFILVNGKWTEILRDDVSKYIGKQYVMRSPMYCLTKHGLCRTCAGRVFANLNVKHVSMFVVDISSTFTTMSLKAMHGTKLEMTDIGDLNQYVIN